MFLLVVVKYKGFRRKVGATICGVIRITIAALLLAFVPLAGAQDWAKEALERSPRHREWVNVKSGNRLVSAFVAYPEVKTKATAVVVIHEIFGMSDWVQMMADELAAAGYIAIAPDLLSGLGTFADANAIGKAIRDLPPDQITADLNAVADYVSKLPAANGKVAVAGFCWGGGQAFRFATNRPSLAAAFVFYGAAPESPDAIAAIRAPVYGFYGGDDARIGATVPKTQELMKAARKTLRRRDVRRRRTRIHARRRRTRAGERCRSETPREVRRKQESARRGMVTNEVSPAEAVMPLARIEDFQPGQHVTFTKTFTEDDLRRFIEITGDVNPLHVDDEFAAQARFGRRVLHGMLTASIFSTMVGMLLPGTGAIYRSQAINFLRPVYVGDTVTAHFVVRSVDRAKHRLQIDSWIENSAGERVIEGTCEAGLLR